MLELGSVQPNFQRNSRYYGDNSSIEPETFGPLLESVIKTIGASYVALLLDDSKVESERIYLIRAGELKLETVELTLSSKLMGKMTSVIWQGLGITNIADSAHVPIGNGEKIVAYLLAGFIEKGRYGERERSVLSVLAENAGLQIARKRLQGELYEANHHLEILEKISGLLPMSSNFESFLGQVINALNELIGVESGGVLLYDAERQELVLQKPSFGTGNRVANLYRLSVTGKSGTSPATAVKVFFSGKPQICNDATADPNADQEYIRMLGIRNFLSMPLIVDNTKIGVLHLINKKAGDFTERDFRLLTMMASQIAIVIKNADLFREIKHQESETTALYETGVELAALLDQDAIVKLMVSKVWELLQCDLVGVGIVVNGEVSVTVIDGNEVRSLPQVRIESGRGLTWAALDTRAPVSFSYPELNSKMVVSLDDLDLFARLEEMQTAMAVPIFGTGGGSGLIYAWRRSDLEFTQKDMNLMQRLAQHAAAVIENANLYYRERVNVVKLKELNNLSEFRQAHLRRMLEIHNQLTIMVLQGNGYQSIAETLTTLVENPVIIEDVNFSLLASATYPVGQPLPAGLPGEYWSTEDGSKLLDELNKQLKSVRIPVQLELGIDCQRLVVPIAAGQEVLGYVTVLEEQRKLEELDSVAMQHASTVFALEMMKDKIAGEVEARLRGDFLEDLLQGNYKTEKEIVNRASFFGYDMARTYQAIILDIDDFSRLAKKLDDEGKVARKKRQLSELVAKRVKELSPQSILTFKSDTIVILADAMVHSQNSMLPTELTAHIRHLVTGSMKEITVSAGIGRLATNIAAARESYREAKLALEVFKKAGRRNFQVSIDEVGIYRLFFQSLDNQELVSFARHLVGPLMEYDRNKAGALIATLKTYLNNGCNLTNTSQAAFLHINTVIYRLQKIEKLLGVSLNDTETRLNLQLALKVLEFMEGNWGD